MHAQAIEDNIRFESSRHLGEMTRYYPKCTTCGEEVMTYTYKSGTGYTCQKCKFEKKLTDRQQKIDFSYENKEKKYNNAVHRIELRVKSMKPYVNALETVHRLLHRNGWFDSTEEIMVAIELVKNKIRARHQVELGRYRADFILPDLKVVLEVDGKIYHQNKEKERLRDELIILALGQEWDVIRISDDLINQNITRLMSAIKTVKKQRKVVRSTYKGILPAWYSKAEI